MALDSEVDQACVPEPDPTADGADAHRLGLVLSAMRLSRMEEARRVLKEKFHLTDSGVVFAFEYSVDLNAKRAAAVAGMSRKRIDHVLKNDPNMLYAVEHAMTARSEGAKLEAEYVREYIRGVLDFCPVDFFKPAPEGGWMIEPEDLARLPDHVRRYIEEVEMRVVRGMRFLAVKFVSKSFALGLAARYTLVQKHAIAAATVDWGQLAAGDVEGKAVEERIAQELALPAPEHTNGSTH